MTPAPRPARSSEGWREALLLAACVFLLLTLCSSGDALAVAPPRALAPKKATAPACVPDVLSPDAPNFVFETGIAPEGRSRSSSSIGLLDVALVACTDGSLHGLNRSNGSELWRLSPQASHAASRLLTPAVKVQYGSQKLDFADLLARMGPGAVNGMLDNFGLYILEPSSNGDIYLLTRQKEDDGLDSAPGQRYRAPPGLRLARVPLTLPQLVAVSPFNFAGDESKVFIGKKETKLVEVNVLNGEIGAVFGEDAMLSERRQGTGVGGTDADPTWRPPSSLRNGWALIGRTDFTLAIHARHSPQASQTLHLSTYGPTIADRETLAEWTSLPYPDSRRMLGLPDEGSLICLNTSHSLEQSDRTLWSLDLGSPVASVFDVIKQVPRGTESARGPPTMEGADVVLAPHPSPSFRDVFQQQVEGSRDDSEAYLGVSQGSLFALSASRHPLVAITPPAPASYDTWRHIEAGHDTTGDGRAPNAHSKCHGISCWTGSYRVQRSSPSQWGLGDMLSPPPLLEAGERPVRPTLPDRPSSTREDVISEPARESAKPSVVPEQAQPRQWSIRNNWQTLAVQAVIMSLLGLFALAYTSGLKLQAKRQAEVVDFLASSVTLVPREDDARQGTQTSLPAVAADAVDAEPSENASDRVATRKAPGAGDVGAREDGRPQVGLSGGPDHDEGEDAADLDEHPAPLSAKEKVAAAKRRRRGKRAGQLVAAKVMRVSGDADNQANGKAAEESVALPDAAEQSDDLALRPVLDAPNVTREHIEDAKLIQSVAPQAAKQESSLILSDKILGYGSSGTVVFQGTFQGRAVAVKRLLKDFVSVASREVDLLASADDHPNVVRYFYQERTSDFLYIALELCSATLADIVEKPLESQDLVNSFEPKKALAQITRGLSHLHSLHIVHRDLKPQNILVATSASGKLKMLLSDFGLSKKLEGLAPNSFSQTVNNPGGTVGWRAPEILRGEVKLDNGSDSTQTSIVTSDGLSGADERSRLTQAVDIFALGCIAYYILSNGDHPFGSRYERELNVVRGRSDLSRLDMLGEEGSEAKHLISALIDADPSKRTSPSDILRHPYFWNATKRLSFLTNASDRFDTMERDPPAAALVRLEEQATEVIGGNWHKRLDPLFVQDLGKFRSYDPKKVQDLLRAMRNKSHHYQDLQPRLQQVVGPLPDGFLAYFTSRFPRLLLHVYEQIDAQGYLRTEPRFRPFFTAEDPGP